MRKFKSERTFGKILRLTGLAILVVGYQNCAPGYVPERSDLSSEFATAPESGGSGKAANPFVCSNQPSPVSSTRRLTKREIGATLVDLFAGKIALASFSDQLETLPSEDPQLNFDTQDQRITSQHVEAYATLSERMATLATANLATLTSASNEACLATQAAPTDACVRSFIGKFGTRVFRRPLTTTEVDKLLALFKADSSATKTEKTQFLLQALLQSPNFTYLIENKGASAGQGLLNLSPYETATRLSYLLTGTMPDAALFTAAAANELSDKNKLNAQITRLLSTAKAKSHVENFYLQWLRYNSVDSFQLSASYADGVSQTNLALDMTTEIRSFINHITWDKKGNYDDLILSRTSFVKTAALAKIYDVNLPTSSSGEVELPEERAGLLTRAALLAESSYSTNPVRRGARIRRQMLCDFLPDPGTADLDLGALEEPEADPTSTTRNRYEIKTGQTACMGCHSQINPLGFAMENFDSFGRHRTKERIFDTDGNFIRDLAVNASAVPAISSARESQISGGRELSEQLVQSSKGRACFVKMWSSFNTGREMQARDGCDLERLYSVVDSSSGGIVEMFKQTARNPSFFQKRFAD